MEDVLVVHKHLENKEHFLENTVAPLADKGRLVVLGNVADLHRDNYEVDYILVDTVDLCFENCELDGLHDNWEVEY